MRKKITAVFSGPCLAIVCLTLATSSAVHAADVEHGKQVFAACAACHSDKPDSIGPSLRRVYGRTSGSLEDFRYSNAMMRAKLTWNDDNLRAYIKDPQSKVPGNRMPFGGVPGDKDIEDVIAYLQTYR